MGMKSLASALLCGVTLSLVFGCGGKQADKKADDKKEPQPVAAADKTAPVKVELPGDLGTPLTQPPKQDLPPIVDDKPGPGVTPSDVSKTPGGSGKVPAALGRAIMKSVTGGGDNKDEK